MSLIERNIAGPVRTALEDTAAVLVNGPRQSGKTTLVRQLAGQLSYCTLDNPSTLSVTQNDPVGFVETLDRAVIVEIECARSSCWRSRCPSTRIAASVAFCSPAPPSLGQAWAKTYIAHLVERDVQDIAHIDQLTQILTLIAVLATQCAQLFNYTQLGAQLGLNAKTADKYIGIVERIFLLWRLPAWRRHANSRRVKTPKFHFLDASLQATLTRLTPDLCAIHRERWGATLETWVYAELRNAWALSGDVWCLSHYNDKERVKVDFVPENPMRQLIGIEIKAADTVQAQDFKGLRRLKPSRALTFSPASFSTMARMPCRLAKGCRPCRSVLCSQHVG